MPIESKKTLSDVFVSAVEKNICIGRDAGTGIRYISFGRGEKTMVIVPGLSVVYVTDSAATLAASFSGFTDDYTVYLFDVREQVPKDYSIRRLSEDLTAAIKNLGLRRIYLYGCSMGGMMSLYIAGKYPELVEKTAVCASACRITESTAGIIRRWIHLAEEKKAHKLAENLGRMIYSKSVYEANADIFSTMADGMTQALLTRFIHTAAAIADMDISREAAAVRCPVFVLGSIGDKLLPVESFEEIAAVTGGKLYLYSEDYPHAVYDEAPDLKARVKAFFDSQK